MGRGGSGRGAGSAWTGSGGDKAGHRGHLVSLHAAAAAAYNKLSKDDPLRTHYEALWPDLAAAKPPAAEPVGLKAVEAAARRLDKLQKKAQVGEPETPAAEPPGAEKTALASLLEQFEKEPDDFHKWAEPDKEAWRAAKAKGEAMAQKVKEHEAETANHLWYLEEETAKHQEQLRQLEQARTKRQTEAQAGKKKARRQFNVDFFNITTWGPQARDYFKEISSTKDRDIIGIAEHHLRQPVQISRARAALRRHGLRSYWTRARPGEGEGTRGGTCAIARGPLDLQDRLARFEDNYLNEEGSDITVVIAHLRQVLFAVAFFYLECGKSLSDRNVDTLCDLREKMAVWGGPWAAMGDFNIAPSEFNDSIWPRVLNAQVVAAERGAPTCFPAEGTARCLDYALVAQGLAPYFDGVKLIRKAPWWPYIGVRLELKGCEEAENDMEVVPQLYYDKEVQHVVSDELWNSAAEQARAKAREVPPPHLQGTVISRLMEQDMLELGQQCDLFAGTLEPSLRESIGTPQDERGARMGHGRPPTFKSASIKDTAPAIPWAGVERKIHAWWSEVASLIRQLPHRDARALGAAEKGQGQNQQHQAARTGDGGGTMGQPHSRPDSSTDGMQRGARPPPAARSTVDMDGYDPFQDEEGSEDCFQQPADKQGGEDNHQRIPDDQDCIGHTCSGWAAIWMDGLSQAPAGNTNWMEWGPPFLEAVFSNGGNRGLGRLLRSWQPRASFGDILRDLCERAWRHAAPRRQEQTASQQLNQKEQHDDHMKRLQEQAVDRAVDNCSRHNEEGEVKEQQQILLATLGMIAGGALVDPATSHQVAEKVRSAAKHLTKAVKKAYIHWVHDVTAGSAKLAQACTKAAGRSHIEDILEHEGQVVPHPQQLVDLRKGARQRRWTRDAHKPDQIQEALGKLRTAALAQDKAIEPLSNNIVGSIIQHLQRNAGQGADWWRAPELKAAGAQGPTEFVQCLNNCEERAAWPWQFYLVLEVLMGFWDTAVAGSSALSVAMHRLMRAEAAVQMGFHAAGIFYDAVNFYDNIDLDQLIEEASDLNYPLLPLAMAVQMYLAPRAIMAHSLFSDIFEPASSMVAGCGQAVDLTRPLPYCIMDAARRHYIYVVIQQYLHDLALLSIPISIKTAVVASDKDLQQEIASILDDLGTPNKQPGVVRDLGVDTGLGKQLKRPAHAARQAKAKQRVEKLKELAKTDARGVAKVYAAGAYGQQAWDLPAHGITPAEATKVRATGAALLTRGHKAGRCTSTILLIQRGAQGAVTRAIVEQVKQLWLTIVDHPTELKRYHRGWHMLYDKLQALEPNRRWNQVKGPMAGVIVQLLGLGWNPRRLDSWASPAGDEWAHRPEDIPHSGALLQEVQLSVQQQLWQQAAEHRRGAGQHAEAAMLETIAVAGIRTRERRRAANLNQEGGDICARCGEAAAAEKHRYYTCPANEEIGHSNNTDRAKKAIDALDQQQDEHFWLRGIPPAAWGVQVDPVEDVEKAAHIFCADAEGGAGATAKGPRLRRCGWAVMAFRYDQDGLPQEVAAWYGTIRAPHTVPRAELTAMSKAIGYTTGANFDPWLMAKRQLQNSTDHIMGHHIPSHMIEHPTELERWTGPTRWAIGNDMADRCASWGAEHGALDPAIIAQQQNRDQITVAAQNRLLGISMAVTVEDPNKGRESSHLDQHENVRLEFKVVQIGTEVVHDTHKRQFTQGWLLCEKWGATSYLGNHKSRIVAAVARKLAKPCAPPTTAGRRVIADLQKGRLPRKAKQEEGQAAAAPLVEVTAAGFNPGASSTEVIDLDGESSEAETPQPAQLQPPRHPHSVAQASWRLVDHMEGYSEQWMNMVGQGVWEDKDDWMEHSVPYLLAVTNAGGRTGVHDATSREIQQIIVLCEDIWRNTHRTRRRLMTHMLALPHGSRQQDYRAWTPEYLDDSSTQPDSEVPELEGNGSDHGMDTIETPDQLNGATSCVQASATVQGMPWIAKPTGPDLMKYVREATDAGMQNPRPRQQRGDEDQDPAQELAWLERNRLD
ncbi:unnamed protein product [Prorocentrum cordatum]|uniref:Reverse transcriptase domain-containing protein n=1 Tax=Prorocentrum cordatum TaxID=2364126 RepID=A0ABN9X4N8_9DINO|nr:unnamed protein product [Polarella glacialis]